MDMNVMFLIGQALGIIAVLIGFVSYQMKTARMILIIQIIMSVVFCFHYLLIGATSALALNIFGIICKFIYCYRDKMGFSGKICPVVLAFVMGIAGALSWQGYYSLFIIVGLLVNTLFLSSKNAQTIRKSILFTSPLVIIYNIFVLSIGGIVYESIAIISALIGIIRYSKSARNNLN